MKKCYKCGVSKEATGFHKNRSASDGLQAVCRECAKAKGADGLTDAQRNGRKMGADGITNIQRYRKKVGADGLTSSTRCRRKVGADGLTASQRTRKKNPNNDINYYYKTTYGFTLADYEIMVKRQGGVCAICNNPPKRGKLHIDHDHDNGKIRELLCEPCNQGIGFLKDSSAVTQLATDYLKKHGK